MTSKLTLPPSLSSMHFVFHLLVLQCYILDESHMISLNLVELGLDLTYEKEPIAIFDRYARKLRAKR